MAASILTEESCAAPGRFERIMRRISLSNNVARTTFPGRFSALNESVQACLEAVFHPDQELIVEDWAVSSGTTATEWYQRLRTTFPKLHFEASDAALYLVEARRRQDTYILQSDGTPIQYIKPPFVVNLVQKHNWAYPANRFVQERALREWGKFAPGFLVPQWADFTTRETISRPPFELRPLPMIHPAVLSIRSERFRIRQHSVFAALNAPVDVIRTMNILNRAYFSEAQLGDAIRAVGDSLKPGGVWIVGRTVVEQPPQHEVTVYRKRSNGWERILRLGPGSEIEPLVPQSRDS